MLQCGQFWWPFQSIQIKSCACSSFKLIHLVLLPPMIALLVPPPSSSRPCSFSPASVTETESNQLTRFVSVVLHDKLKDMLDPLVSLAKHRHEHRREDDNPGGREGCAEGCAEGSKAQWSRGYRGYRGSRQSGEGVCRPSSRRNKKRARPASEEATCEGATCEGSGVDDRASPDDASEQGEGGNIHSSQWTSQWSSSKFRSLEELASSMTSSMASSSSASSLSRQSPSSHAETNGRLSSPSGAGVAHPASSAALPALAAPDSGGRGGSGRGLGGCVDKEGVLAATEQKNRGAQHLDHEGVEVVHVDEVVLNGCAARYGWHDHRAQPWAARDKKHSRTGPIGSQRREA